MQRYFAKEKINNGFRLSENDLYHIRKVMRMTEKDKIEIVFDEKVYICKVTLDDNYFEVLSMETSKITFPEIILVVPLLKEQKMDLIFQKSTELGVSKIIPINTERSIIRIDEEKYNRKRERWQTICKEASEQSKRVNVPVVDKLSNICELKQIDGVKLVCSTIEKNKNLKNFLQTHNKCDKIVLAVGPEGGFSILEERKFEEAGFTKVSLGNRILRVETVPMFLLSILNYVCME